MPFQFEDLRICFPKIVFKMNESQFGIVMRIAK